MGVVILKCEFFGRILEDGPWISFFYFGAILNVSIILIANISLNFKVCILFNGAGQIP